VFPSVSPTLLLVSNPPFYPELQRMGFEPAALPNFAFMAAITFVDTVVSHVNAYELDERFAQAPSEPFSVANAVQTWIDAGRF